ncbi:MAG TPA: hypothetical protein VGO70_00815 [Arsenicitalea sp.]|jgi:hypothetical protein|nr:hypothetical protein [Arsenicitalea sp.]
MNPANLQLEGLYLAIAALVTSMRENNVLSADQIDAALDRAETLALSDPERIGALSPSNMEAICFPIRLLRLANRTPSEEIANFSDMARIVGQTKDILRAELEAEDRA